MANDFEETVEYNEAAGVYKPKPLVGLSSLSKEERDAFINKQVAAGKLPKKWSIGQADRLYKNKQFIDKYGLDVFKNLTDENALSTMNIQMEEFYATAKDADYLIYNSAIDGELYTMDELIEKSSMLKDFKAVKNGDVWCTGKNMFQETTGIADMIVDINSIVNGADGDLEYIHKLTE